MSDSEQIQPDSVRDCHYLACDLGADSGRVMLGTLSDGAFSLESLHRFPTQGMRHEDGSLRWDLTRIFGEVVAGLRKGAALGLSIRGISVDSWGVDYVWMSPDGTADMLPYHYRDERTRMEMERVFARLPQATIYAKTGIQFLSFNTLYQLSCDVRSGRIPNGPNAVFLPIADAINALLSGRQVVEYASASTTQCFSPKTMSWERDLIRQAGIPDKIFADCVPSGTVLGSILPQWRKGFPALESTSVVAGCSHDTAAAVAAVPASMGDDWAFLSSGTWSLLGVELPQPLMHAEALKAGFTNEVGYGGQIRFLKNIAGLWLLQESQRSWKSAGLDVSYAEIDRRAAAAEPLRSLIFPNDPVFASPGDMPEKIAQFCAETGQPIPRDCGEIARCIMESLALLYADTLSAARSLTGHRLERLHIVGGGSRSCLLNQFTASACGVDVLAGPSEATALGNLAVQALALGDLKNLWQARQAIARQEPLQRFAPADAALWQAGRQTFKKLFPRV